MAWTGTSLTATGPVNQISAPPPGASKPAGGSASPQAGRAGDSGRRQNSPTPFSAFEWWNDAEIKKEIGLSDEKAKRIQDFFENRNLQMQPLIEDWRRERALLDKMTQAREANESSYGVQVWRFEAVNARLRESRAMMVYRMYMQLQPDQYKKLRELLDRRFNNGRGGRGGPHPR